MPRPKKSVISTSDVEIPVNPAVMAGAAQMAPPEVRPPFHPADLEIVDSRKGMTREHMALLAKEEKFMNEMVTIFVEMDEEPNSPIFIPAGHQGTQQYIQRGIPQIVKRKYFYSLLMGKKVTTNVTFGRRDGGGEVNDTQRTAKNTYRATLVEDNNTERGGMRWVQSVLSQAA